MGSTALGPQTESAILARVLELPADGVTPAVAECLLAMRFPDGDVERMNELSEKAQLGELSADEQKELDSYIHVGNLLGLVHAMARRKLRAAASA